LTDLVAKQRGVYALYKGGRLYYVGLASNLRNRIKNHLKDRHAGKWDKFSLYLVRKADHIKELESLILRIADPTGNATRGRLVRAENFRANLESEILKAQDEQRREVLGPKRIPGRKMQRSENGEWVRLEELSKSKPQIKPRRRGGRQPTLAPYVKNRFKIRGTLKGATYEARVRRNGLINFNGRIYNSPSTAAKAAIGHYVDGWYFWRFQNKDGEWVKLDSLRK
jgi:hypothetical protein